MTYSITTRDGATHDFADLSEACDWAEAALADDWRAVSCVNADRVDDEWHSCLTVGQIAEIAHWTNFTLVMTQFGALTCQTDDMAMLVLASRWGLASVTIRHPEGYVAPRDFEIMRAHIVGREFSAGRRATEPEGGTGDDGDDVHVDLAERYLKDVPAPGIKATADFLARQGGGA